MQKNSPYLAYIALVVTPFFFSTNVVFGKMMVEVDPFLLACLRWLSVSIILLLITFPKIITEWRSIWQLKGRLAVLAFLGMWICGAIVYMALQNTTATNGILIYATAPVVVIILEKIFFGRVIAWREIIGIVLAFAGVCTIVFEGVIEKVLSFSFNPGDLFFALSTVSWAFYTVMQKDDEIRKFSNLFFLGVIASFGTLLLIPFALHAAIQIDAFASVKASWHIMLGIIFLSSIAPFTCYQYGIKILGPSVASLFMYLMPVSGLALAWVMLGEGFELFHILGACLIIFGVVISTWPRKI